MMSSKKHIENHDKASRKEEFNCDTCDFQDTSRKALRNHLERSSGHKPSDKSHECKNCKIVLNSYYLLMNHRKKEHPTDKVCRYFRDGKCNFHASECWYSHEEKPHKNTSPTQVNNEYQDFQKASKNLPPDMKKMIDQLIKISSTKLS